MTTETLKRMGIANPDEIARYTLRQRSGRQDVLKIYYEREKGSLLPVSRTYRFGRGLQTSVADSGEPRFSEGYEVSPVLLAAIEELDALVAGRTEAPPKEALLAEIDAMRAMLQQGASIDASALTQQLDRLTDRAKRV